MNNTVAVQGQLTPFDGGGTMFDDILTDSPPILAGAGAASPPSGLWWQESWGHVR
jgi:hypothetical protein